MTGWIKFFTWSTLRPVRTRPCYRRYQFRLSGSFSLISWSFIAMIKRNLFFASDLTWIIEWQFLISMTKLFVSFHFPCNIDVSWRTMLRLVMAREVVLAMTGDDCQPLVERPDSTLLSPPTHANQEHSHYTTPSTGLQWKWVWKI